MDRAGLEQLISRVALKDRAAFETLYAATSAKLFGVCLRILNDQTEAEEALQETYIKVWRSCDGFVAGKASPISWLAMIARNTAIDAYRRKRPASKGIEEAENVADALPSPEAVAVLSNDIVRLNACMKELDQRHSGALRQIYLSGWTYAEAAESLSVPVNTVKTWVRRSLVSLRECLNR